MCCVQRRRLLSPYCISQFSLLLIHTHLVSWDMRRQACWVTDASQKRVWGPEAHSVIWSNTHVMMRHCEPHGRRQRRRIIWERAFCVCEPVGTSACYTLHSWPYVFTVREKADIWRPLLHSGPLAYLTHGLYRGETQTQPEITSVSQQASPEIHFLTKLCLVSIQEQLNVHCLIREKYSLAGRASSHCDWSLVLKNSGSAALLCPQHSACLPQDSGWGQSSSRLRHILCRHKSSICITRVVTSRRDHHVVQC